MTQAEGYLVEVEKELRLDQKAEEEVLREIYDHLQDRTVEFCEAGYSQKEAVEKAIENLGPAKFLAQKIHEARSGEGWRRALLAGAPHFLIALTFAVHLWRNVPWVATILIPIIASVAYGFRKFRPAWIYPWLGYSVLACGFVFIVAGEVISFSSPWYWLMLLLLCPPAIWLAGSLFIQILRRDWLFTSLSLLPFLITAGWLLTLGKGFSAYQGEAAKGLDIGIALSFFALGVTTAAFIHSRKRFFRFGLLLIATPTILIFLLPSIKGAGLFLSAFLVSAFLLLLPALLEPKLKRRLGEPAWLKQVMERG